MLCVSLKSLQDVLAACTLAPLIELRFDLFSSWSLEEIRQLRSQIAVPMIFTLRSCRQGGGYRGSVRKQLSDLRSLIALEPEYVDLESTLPIEFMQEIASCFPRVRRILSYHNFKHTPDDLDAIYENMEKLPGDLYKVAAFARSSNDAVRLYCWARKKKSLLAISMGPYGELTRVMKAPINYACLRKSDQTAPGQMEANHLINRYAIHQGGKEAKLLGLIGSPVAQSPSDRTHNALLRKMHFHGPYVKIPLEAGDLPEFMGHAKKLPMVGLSVTTPLKECVMKEIDEIDSAAKKIGAVNTLCFTGKKVKGYNTDGIGALNAIETQGAVKGKKILILGAGGAAKAIAYEAHQRGAQVIIANRTVKKARELASQLSGEGVELKTSVPHEILVNATTVSWPIPPSFLLSGTLCMDINLQGKDSCFLKVAREKGCHIIPAYNMFAEQAIEQFKLWFPTQKHQFLKL